MRPARLLIFALSLIATPLAAQEAAGPWRLSYFPYFNVTPNDGLMGIARVIAFRQAPWGGRQTLANSVALEAGYSTRDSWLARATWANPRLADGWRLVAHGEIAHQDNFGHPDSDVGRDIAVSWVDVTRQVRGPLHVAVRGGLRNDELQMGDASTDDTDATIRGAVVVDLRDREFEVNRGALLEGGVISGSGGDGYTAGYAHLRGWYNPVHYLRFTGRFAWRQPVAGASLAARTELPGWEAPFEAIGGHRSHRGFGIGQLGGEGFSVAGAEVRLDVLNVGEMGAFTLLAFVDAGKQLWESDVGGDESWHTGIGGGFALRVLRAATLTVTASGGDGETRWYVGSGWSW